MRMPAARIALALFALPLILVALLKASPKEPLRLALKMEKLTAAAGGESGVSRVLWYYP